MRKKPPKLERKANDYFSNFNSKILRNVINFLKKFYREENSKRKNNYCTTYTNLVFNREALEKFNRSTENIPVYDDGDHDNSSNNTDDDNEEEDDGDDDAQKLPSLFFTINGTKYPKVSEWNNLSNSIIKLSTSL